MPMGRQEQAERALLPLDLALYHEARRATISAIAGKYGYTVQVLSQNLSPDVPGRRPTLSQFEDICTEAVSSGGGDLIRDSLGQLLGCVFVPLPAVTGEAGPAVMKEVSELVGSVGSMSANVSEALADGRVDRDELAMLEKDLHRLYQRGYEVIQAAQAYAGEGRA